MCPYFGRCGGCDLWELPYEEQIAWKKKTLLDALAKALPACARLPPLTVVPSAPFGYRARVELHRLDEAPPARRVKKLSLAKRKAGAAGAGAAVSIAGAGGAAGAAGAVAAAAGFMAKGGGGIIPVNNCPVAVPAIQEALRRGLLTPPPPLGRWAVFAPPVGQPPATRPPETAAAETAGTETAAARPPETAAGTAGAVTAAPPLTGGVLLAEEGGGGFPSRGKAWIHGRSLIVDAGVFFQSNIGLLEKMIEEVCAEAQKTAATAAAIAADRRGSGSGEGGVSGGRGEGGAAWDLYCGAGVFAVFLKDYFPRLVLMEAQKTALLLARENVENRRHPAAGEESGGNAAGARQVQYYALDDSAWVKEMRKRKNMEKPAFVSVDPSRKGLSPALAAFLCETAPETLLYISCNPAALARDAKALFAGGFALKKLTFYDFYPQTRHIETLALFKPR